MSDFDQAWQARKAARGNGCNPRTEFKAGWDARAANGPVEIAAMNDTLAEILEHARTRRRVGLTFPGSLTAAALSEPQTLSGEIKPLPSETAPDALTGLQGPTVAITQNRQVGITIESRPASEIPDRDKSAPTVLQGACGNCRTVNVGEYCDCKCRDWKERL